MGRRASNKPLIARNKDRKRAVLERLSGEAGYIIREYLPNPG